VFLSLWTAETASQFGSPTTAIALPLVAILVLEAGAFEVGLLNAADTLPFLIVGLPAGVWIDRLRRRPILIVGDLGRAVLLASIPVAHLLGVLSMVQLYLVGFLVGVLTVFFDVAYQSYLPALIDRDRLVDGNAKLEISRSAAAVAGPPVGGALVGVLSAPIAILLDAVSFLASAIFLFAIRKPEPAPEPHLDEAGERVGMLRSIREGLAYVGTHRLPSGKHTPYREDSVVPAVLIGPGIPAGGVVDAMTSTIDLAPTIATLMGAQAPDWVDGRDLSPLLQDPQRAPWRTGVLTENLTATRPGDPDYSGFEAPTYQALRTEDFLYVSYGKKGTALYDLRADPYEMDNVIATADRALVTQLAAQLDALSACSGPSCRVADSLEQIVSPAP
jgi:MFS family permease